MNIKTAVSCLLSAFVIINSVSCRQQTDPSSRMKTPQLTALLKQWNHYKEINRQDSIVITATPYFYRSLAKRDTLSVQYAGILMAQAYLLLDADYDSTRRFLSELKPYFDKRTQPNITSIYHNVMGHWALKYELDYSQALTSYLEAFEYAGKTKDFNNQIVMLYNIVNIFYVRSDGHGTKYAEQALLLSQEHRVDVFHKIAAHIAKAQMCCLSSENEEALTYLQRAQTMAQSERISYWAPTISLLHGDIYSEWGGDFDSAKRCYEEALTQSSHTEPSTVSLIYLNYGSLYEKTKEREKALDMYLKGLKLSYETNNMEFRKELLKSAANLLYDMGREELATGYYRKYVQFLDSLLVESKEQNFSNKLLAYSEIQHNYEIAQRNLALSENKRRLVVIVFVLLLVLLLAAAAFVSYLRQRKTYKDAIKRYDEYYRRLISENKKQEVILKTETASESDGLYEKLYLKMESLMRQGVFRNKDLSLEKMAAMVGSNRTYASNTINKMANTSFYNYVNSYRIKEAIRVLSDPSLSLSVSLKSLADQVGYNSIQVFHKAFKEETGATPGIYKSEILKMGRGNPRGS